MLINFLLGLLYAVGFYPLFYITNRPPKKWRDILLLGLIVLGRPFFLIWQYYLQYNVSSISTNLVIADYAIEAMLIFIFAFLGAHRLRTLVTCAYIFCILIITPVLIAYMGLLMASPFVELSINETVAQSSNIFYLGNLFISLITIGSCLIAERWLRRVPKNPPLKYSAFFTSIYITFALVVLVWWRFIKTTTSTPVAATFFMGVLLLAVLVLLFYLFTRLVSNTVGMIAIPQATTSKYVQFLPNLSRRELEVIQAVLSGNTSYKELADTLNISINTVKTHLKHIYQITGASNITALMFLFRGYTPSHPAITSKSP
jgi:DNA-binding CsgD family transcriptional regulator